MGDVADRLDVDHLQRRVGDAFEEHRPGAWRQRRAPLAEVGAVYEDDLDAAAGQDLLEDVEAGAE